MTDNKQTENSGKSQKAQSIKMLVISILVLLGAFGIGIVIRNARTDKPEKEPVVQKQDVDNQQKEPVVKYTIPENIVIPEPDPEEEVVVESKPEPRTRPVREPAHEEPVQNQPAFSMNEQRMQDAMQWFSWFSNLSQEDRQILAQGVQEMIFSVIQRWQYMAPEQAQAEREELEQLFRGWQDMPQEERQQGIQIMQMQIEQWLQYGQQY